MDGKLLTYIFILLIAGILSVATSAIGVKCSNACTTFKENNQNNFRFLIVNLVSAIVVIIIALIGTYFTIKK